MTAKEPPRLLVSAEVVKLGVNVIMAVFNGCNIVNKNGALERLKKEVVSRVREYDIETNPILREYSKLQAEAGIQNPIPPAQHLITLAKKSGRIPNINTAVDSYNLVSAESFLSIGAHNIEKMEGDVRFVITKGGERYTPLGSSTRESVNPGEYACMDNEKILCRLDIKQCDETKVTKDTSAFIVYVQGNSQTSMPMLETALQNTRNNIASFCGGNSTVVTQTIV